MKNILVTGGCGYIGSHVVRHLQKEGFNIVVIDDLSKGIRRFVKNAPFYKSDFANEKQLKKIFSTHSIDTIVHLAAFTEVEESFYKPIEYYENNFYKSSQLLKIAYENGIKNFVFSSTSAVYIEDSNEPMTEEYAKIPSSAYGQSKLFFEHCLSDFSKLNTDFSYVVFRFFNAAGADTKGDIGEIRNPATSLVPVIFDFLFGKRNKFTVFGSDYPTPDGTCIRDYIHVNDLALAIEKAVLYLEKGNKPDTFNLGYGFGYSVLDVLKKVEKITGHKINYVLGDRRVGDTEISICDSKKAKSILEWSPKFDSLDKIIKDAYRFYKKYYKD
jgi:UDP-glucose 4-epimerase